MQAAIGVIAFLIVAITGSICIGAVIASGTYWLIPPIAVVTVLLECFVIFRV